MANCCKCSHAKEIARLRDICLNCSIGKAECGLSHGGVSHVSMDAAADGSLVLRGRVAPDYVRPGRRDEQRIETPLGPDERTNLLKVLVKFAELGADWDDAGLICSMLNGKTIDQIARERCVSPQTVHARWTRITTADPTWRSIANGMIGSGRGRKPKRPKFMQMELF